MSEETIRIKFVREGAVVTTYQWTQIFWFIGYWTSVSSVGSSDEESAKESIRKVDILAKYKAGEKLNNQNFWV